MIHSYFLLSDRRQDSAQDLFVAEAKFVMNILKIIQTLHWRPIALFGMYVLQHTPIVLTA